MAYLNIQKAEFNRATENLIEIAWKYESLKVEYDFLTNTDSMSWKHLFVAWANEFEGWKEKENSSRPTHGRNHAESAGMAVEQ